MTRLWRDQGKRKEARELLAPVYGWFTEGQKRPRSCWRSWRKTGGLVRLPSAVHPSGHTPWDDSGTAQGWAVRAKTHQRPPQADYGPVRQFDSVGCSLRHDGGDAPAGAAARHMGFPHDPSAQRRRGIAPKNIATFNTHSEALEPMAGATFTRYDAPSTRAGGGNEKALQSRQQTS
jgi:hypothetical protein